MKGSEPLRDSSSCSESTSVTTPDIDLLKTSHRKPTRKGKSNRPSKKFRAFGSALMDASDSSDSDYLPPEQKSPNLRQRKRRKIKKRKMNMKGEDEHENICHNATQKSKVDISAPTNGEETWSILPREILIHIFHYLANSDGHGVRYVCRCSCVCRNWNATIQQPISWKYADLAFIGGLKNAKDKLLRELTEQKFSQIKELDLCGWVNLTDEGLESVARNCKRLENLNISNCQKKTLSKISGPMLVNLAENCPLKRINFSRLHVIGSYAKNFLKFIEVCGANLTYINISGNISIGSSALNAIATSCYQLISLDASNTSVRSFSFQQLQNTCTELHELFLANLSLELKPTMNCSGFPQLTVCSIAVGKTSEWVTDNVLQTILKSSQQLTILDARGSLAITAAGLQLPARKLQRLYISRCRLTLQMVRTICEQWSETLWDLDISWTEPYGASCDDLIEALLNSVHSCVNITHLNVSGMAITDKSVRRIVLRCRSLVLLDLVSCRGVSRGIKRLHKGKKTIKKLLAKIS